MAVSAQAQPNIALIKYWGKRDAERNLPAVSSLSITLESLQTRMTVTLDETLPSDSLAVNDEDRPAMLQRVTRCLDEVCGSSRARARVASSSNFPIGGGLASSAAAFAALVVAADRASGNHRPASELARIAGHASGSAARSLFGGFVELSAGSGDSDIEVRPLLAVDVWPLTVVVAITAEGPKAVGSGDAMIRGAASSPFYSSWVSRQGDDMRLALEAIDARDFGKLAAVAEHNCLKMHSVMWTSRPPVVYWNAATLNCLQTIRRLQSDGKGVFFTIDAGPQVKAVCLPGDAAAVRDALQETPGVQRTMESGLGRGARLLDS
jgi:diphosphomevalonate decarboxylase